MQDTSIVDSHSRSYSRGSFGGRDNHGNEVSGGINGNGWSASRSVVSSLLADHLSPPECPEKKVVVG